MCRRFENWRVSPTCSWPRLRSSPCGSSGQSGSILHSTELPLRQASRGNLPGRWQSRSIPNAEARAQALILVAESQCRDRAHDQAAKATETYSDAAIAVSRIEREGLRGVITGYLVDSLISTGRFEDARACLVLYPTEAERFVALGAIAESQGRRGSADAAREWISRDAPPAYRSALFRRVNSGVLTAIGNERQNKTRVVPPRESTE